MMQVSNNRVEVAEPIIKVNTDYKCQLFKKAKKSNENC